MRGRKVRGERVLTASFSFDDISIVRMSSEQMEDHRKPQTRYKWHVVNIETDWRTPLETTPPTAQTLKANKGLPCARHEKENWFFPLFFFFFKFTKLSHLITKTALGHDGLVSMATWIYKQIAHDVVCFGSFAFPSAEWIDRAMLWTLSFPMEMDHDGSMYGWVDGTRCGMLWIIHFLLPMGGWTQNSTMWFAFDPFFIFRPWMDGELL